MKISKEVEVTLPNRTVTMENAYVGAKVMRGPDWKWRNQDGGEGNIGTIENVQANIWVSVRWSRASWNSYRVGAEDSYDLIFAE